MEGNNRMKNENRKVPPAAIPVFIMIVAVVAYTIYLTIQIIF